MAAKNYIFDAGMAHSPPTRRHPVTKGIERIPFTVPALDSRGRRAQRWILMCDAEGNTVRVALTTGASEPFPTGTYAERKRTKMERAGWFPFGRCPRALAAVNEFDADQLEEAVRALPTCEGKFDDDHPCPCAQLERKLRQERHSAAERRRAAAWKGDAEKVISAQNDTTAAVLELVRTLATREAKGAGVQFENAIAAVKRMNPDLTDAQAQAFIERQVSAALEQIESQAAAASADAMVAEPAGAEPDQKPPRRRG